MCVKTSNICTGNKEDVVMQRWSVTACVQHASKECSSCRASRMFTARMISRYNGGTYGGSIPQRIPDVNYVMVSRCIFFVCVKNLTYGYHIRCFHFKITSASMTPYSTNLASAKRCKNIWRLKVLMGSQK